MKNLIVFFATLCCWFGILSSSSQTIKFPDDSGKDCNQQTYSNCLDYIKNNRVLNGETLEDYTTRFYPINSTGDLFVISLVKSHNEKTKVYSDKPFLSAEGIFLPKIKVSHTATLVKNVKEQNTIVVFVNKQGEPIKSIGGFNSKMHIKVLDNNKVLLINGYFDEENGKKIQYFREMALFELNCVEKWQANNDMYFRDYALSNNNIYLVGTNKNSEYKVINLHDGSIVLDKVLPAANYKDSRFTKVSLKKEGVTVTREYQYNKKTEIETFPYESNDKGYQEILIVNSFNKNEANDQVSIGLKYLNGDQISKDEKKAVEWFQKAANQNNDKGLYRLGYCYQKGIGIGQDKTKAAALYEQASNKGNIEAMAALSKMYLDGDGVPKDLPKALRWQEILAFDGDKNAQKVILSNQSVQYQRADIRNTLERSLNSHKEKNYSWAEYCIKRAIESGDNDARLYYGLWLGKGEGVQKDYAKAEEYLTPFAEKDNEEAASVLGSIYRDLNDKKKEMFWVEKAALKGDVDSQLKMAEAYLTGNGVKKNKKMAAEMYEKAAVSGNQDAAIKLVYSYGTGKGMKKDESQCLMWFNRLSLENQLEVAEDFDENPKIKCTIGLVINMYEEIAKTKNYEAMKRFAELSVEYRGYDNAVKALNLLESAKNVSYSTKNADVYMLWGKLHERQGNIGEAISCYRNSGTQEGRERAIMLNR